jgi:ABC-2 type transport system ATP-binding protein
MSITFDGCSYWYKRKGQAVLDNFSYQLPEGLTILLGPNGAGKSTLLKLAASVLQPQVGEIRLDGISSRSRTYRRHISWMPQHITAMAGLTAREQVAYTGWLKGMRRGDAWREAVVALEAVNLRDQADAKAPTLSGGQLRRLGVASALVHGCEVMLLDEPTAGMDPTQRRVFRDLLTATAATGDVKILMSTHDVADLTDDADHVTVLSEGRIRYTGTSHDFLSQAPAGTAESRSAEAAYTALTRQVY